MQIRSKHQTVIGLFAFSFLTTIQSTTSDLFQKSTRIDDVLIEYKASGNQIEFFVNSDEYSIKDVECTKTRFQNNKTVGTNICENLDPCSTYSANLFLENVESGDIIQRKTSASTTYLKPEVHITATEPTQNSIYVSWEATNVDCISYFLITAKSEYHNSRGETSEVFHNFTELFACETFLIELKAYDINDKNFVGEDSITKETFYADPGTVTSISFEEVINNKNDSVRVKWESPEQRFCVEYYHLQWTNLDCFDENGNDENCIWNYHNLTDPYVREYTISDLKGCDNYGLMIAINDETNENLTLSTFTSPEQIPGQVVDLNPIVTHDSVNMTWTAPTKNRKCAAYYKIYLIGPLQKIQTDTSGRSSTTNFAFRLLSPCGQYNVSVQAISMNEFLGPPTNTTFETTEYKPTQIRNVQTDLQPKEISLYWDEPDYSELCIKEYRLVSWDPNNEAAGTYNSTTTNTSMKFENLVACQMYAFQVIPVTHKNEDGAHIHIHVETTATVTSTPREPESTNKQTSYNKLLIDTKDLDQTNKCPILFAKFKCVSSGDVKYKVAESIVVGDIKDVVFKATLEPVSPHSTYECEVSLYNIAGFSNISKALILSAPYYPEIPQNIQVGGVSNASISYLWKEPKYANGALSLYHLYFKRVGPAYEMPSTCENDVEAGITIPKEKNEKRHQFDTAKAYTVYSFQMASENEFGKGLYSDAILITTLPWISDPVEVFKTVAIEGPDPEALTYKSNVTLHWQSPCHINGEILHYELNFTGRRANYELHEFNQIVLPVSGTDGYVTYTEHNLRPEHVYSVHLYVKNKMVPKLSEPTVLNYTAPAGIPKSTDVEGIATVNVFDSKNPTTSALVRFPLSLLDSENGDILYAALLVSEMDCQPDPDMHWDKIDSLSQWPKTLTWSAVQTNDCTKQYQTTPMRWAPTQLQADARDGRDASAVIEYTIGQDECTLYQDKQYCNGPLKADTKYKLIVRLFTRSGFNDTGYLIFKTDALLNIFVIVLSVVSCLILAFLMGFLYLYITKRLSWHLKSQDLQDPTGNITAKDFYLYYFVVSKMEKIVREYKELQVVANDFSITASNSNENKNRYCNIFPYDKNRVILDIDSEGSDYINASFINGYRKKKEYIATQGPKPESFIDFWRMILQHNVRVIVMVTQFKEGDVIKCHPYFPTTLGKELKFGNNMTVSCRKEIFEDIFEKRELTVTHASENYTRKVIHYYFKKWPDHDCPKDPADLIAFVKKVKSEKMSSHSPIVIHCSAGVGRTGTFIGLDIIMQRLKNEGTINIYETVKDLRFQRMKMVQSIQQYTFLYRCTYELLNRKYNGRSKFKLNLKGDKKKVNFKEEEENNVDILCLGSQTENRNSNSSKSDTVSNASSDNQSFRPNNIESFM